jgi:NADH-quinone oxidoreductase subunit E
MSEERKEVCAIVAKYEGRRDSLISILQDIQSLYHYLPEHSLKAVSRELKIPLMQVYSVATFFKAFSLEPRGEHLVCVCMGTACHVRGAQSVFDEAKRRLNIEAGHSTADMKYSLETVNCLGACALGPLLVIDGEYHGQMTTAKVKKALKNQSSQKV